MPADASPSVPLASANRGVSWMCRLSQNTARPGTAPRASRIRQMVSFERPDASSPEAISGPITSPTPCIANTSPTIAPREDLPEYSLMIVAETG
jgi:hypothetical protein